MHHVLCTSSGFPPSRLARPDAPFAIDFSFWRTLHVNQSPLGRDTTLLTLNAVHILEHHERWRVSMLSCRRGPEPEGSIDHGGHTHTICFTDGPSLERSLNVVTHAPALCSIFHRPSLQVR